MPRPPKYDETMTRKSITVTQAQAAWMDAQENASEIIRDYINERMNEMDNYGSVTHNGKAIKLTSDADFTSRLMPYKPYHEAGEGDTYIAEMSANGIDEDGNECTVYWEFEFTKGNEPELDTLDYDTPERVVLDY